MKGEISKRRSQRGRRGCSRVVVQFRVSVLPQWQFCGAWLITVDSRGHLLLN